MIAPEHFHLNVIPKESFCNSSLPWRPPRHAVPQARDDRWK